MRGAHRSRLLYPPVFAVPIIGIILFSMTFADCLVYAQTTAAPSPLVEGDAIREALRPPLTEEITLIGLLGIGDRWRVALRNVAEGQTLFLREGETAFGYRVKKIMTDEGAILLEKSGEEFQLRLGESISGLNSPGGMDLRIALSPKWIEDWHNTLTTLTPAEQQTAREQARDYWRQQWEAGLVDHVLTLEPEEQIRIRREIRRYWRE